MTINVNGDILIKQTKKRINFKLQSGFAPKIAKYIIGKIKIRTNKQIDMNGFIFDRYTKQYWTQLGEAGQDQKVDLRLNGWMMDSLNLRKTKATKDTLKLTIGPNTAQMPRTKLTKKGRKRTGGTRPPNNAIAYYHHFGKGNLPKRQFLGLTKKEKDGLKKYVQNMIRKALK